MVYADFGVGVHVHVRIGFVPAEACADGDPKHIFDCSTRAHATGNPVDPCTRVSKAIFIRIDYRVLAQ